MPELPEVEVTTRKLKPLIVGKRVLGRKILNIERLGKAILIHLSGGKILGFHQRMSGRILAVSRGFKNKYIRHRFALSGGKDLVMHDVRKFGVVWYGPAKKVMSDQYFRTLGPDALSVSFKDFKELLIPPPTTSLSRRGAQKTIPSLPANWQAGFTRRGEGRSTLKLRRKVGAVKSFLLNQKNIAGIGNIMADEILWKAKISPEARINNLTTSQVVNLWKAIKLVLKRSIKMGGSTMRDWLRPDGDRGGYFEKRFVYDREGEPCPRCTPRLRRPALRHRLRQGDGFGGQAKILRKKIAGRSSYFCPRCQML